MNESNYLTLVLVLVLAGVLAYRMSFLKQKRLWNFTLQQIMMLVVLPGVLFPLIFSYVRTLSALPRLPQAVFPDGLLINMVLLSVLFTYGGVAIHAVTKVLNEHTSVDENTEIMEINRFFHLTFSHNLTYAGAILSLLGITLLELNHVNGQTNTSLVLGILRGLLLGTVFSLATFNYTRYTGGDMGRWNDLKAFFGIIWIALVVLIYAIRRVDPRITEYQLLLPSLLSFSIMVLLSFVLVVRRVKRGWQVRIRRRALQHLMEDLGVPQ